MIISNESFINVSGGKIWSEILYTEETKNLPPLICLHGGPGSTHDKIKYGLAGLAKFFPIIFYDQLGGGRSELLPDEYDNYSLWTIDRFVTELHELIKFYDLSEFNLFGTSWGSSLALEYYFSEYRTKPNKIILGSPLISTEIWIADANLLKSQMPSDIYKSMIDCEENNQTDSEAYNLAITEFYNRHVLRKPCLNIEQLDFLENNKSKFNSAAYNYMWGPSEFYASGTLISYDRFVDLSKINIPVLFIGGEFDEARPDSLLKYQKQVSNAECIVISGASHCGYFERSDDYARELYRFITK